MGVIMKKVKTIIAMMLIMSIVFGILGCNTIEQVEELSAKDFKNALEDVFDANDDEIVETFVGMKSKQDIEKVLS